MCERQILKVFVGVATSFGLPCRQSLTAWLLDIKGVIDRRWSTVIGDAPFNLMADGSVRKRKQLFPLLVAFWSDQQNKPLCKLLALCDLQVNPY